VKNESRLAWLVAGTFLGAFAVAAMKGPAVAQAQTPHGPWVFGQSAMNVPSAWRLNATTGEMDYCYTLAGQGAGCIRIPNSN
jgi:hypothetical protein